MKIAYWFSNPFLKTLPLVVSCLFIFFKTQAQGYKQLTDGMLINFVNPAAHHAKAVRLSVDTIIRVTGTPTGKFSTAASLMVLPVKTSAPFKLRKAGADLLLQTASVTATVSLKTGAVSFTDKAGKSLLREANTGNIFTPAPVDGEQQYKIEQCFKSPAGEAFYGHGQHQEGATNYRGLEGKARP